MATIQDSSHPTGVRDTAEKPGRAVVAARERKGLAALEMKRKTMCSWAEVAETLGYPSPRHALVAAEQALTTGLAGVESQEFMRHMAGEKLHELLYSVWDKATDAENPEHLAAVTKARELIAEHAKLYGYIAPTQLAIYSPQAAEIEAWVGKLMAERAPDVVEGSIFDDDDIEMTPNDEGVFERVEF